MTVRVARDPQALAESIQAALASCPTALIAIDGADGVGKSYLAHILSNTLSADHIHVDCFLNQERGGYLSHIRYDELKTHLAAAMRQSRHVLIDGVCMQEVLRRLGRTAGLSIYVRRVGSNGRWDLGEILADYETAQQAIEAEEQMVRALRRSATSDELQELVPPLRKETLCYHFQFRPHEKADFIFERVAD